MDVASEFQRSCAHLPLPREMCSNITYIYASLIHSAVNLKMGKQEERPLLCVLQLACCAWLLTYDVIDVLRTGVHTVADVYCMGCNDRMGWYYHRASDSSQKYKEGMSPRCYLGCWIPIRCPVMQGNICWSARNSSKRKNGTWMTD